MKNTVLLVVDVQERLVQEHPYKEEMFLNTLQQLIAHCRANDIPVVYIQHTDPAGEELEEGCPAWQIAEPVAPKENEVCFQKNFNSAFVKTELHEYLKELGITTIILTGMQTEYCLDTTCKSAFERDYSIIVPREANTTFDNGPLTAAQIHDFYNKNIWDGRFAKVVSAAELMSR